MIGYGKTRWLGLLLLVMAISRTAGASEPLPNPLPLATALAAAQNPAHFDLVSLDQQLDTLRAELGIQQGQNGFSLDLKARLREVGTSNFALPGDEDGDNAASLILFKPIYDFGLQNSRERALLLRLEALELQKRLKTEQRRIEIMQRYFDVLNADNVFLAANEALAIGFNRWDDAVQDYELGLVAEIEVLRLQSEYEAIRQQRYAAQQQQRLTRAILAEAMGYSAQLPSDLEAPDLDAGKPLPQDFESLVAQALSASLEAQVAVANTRAAQAAIMIAEADDGPSVDFEIEVSEYQRDSRLRDDWRASLYFEIPLYSSTSTARVELASAQHRLAVADQQQLHSNLRLEVLQLWQKLQQQQLVIEGKTVEQQYRDRYLDRSRAEYELEFKTDLGDSMVQYSRTRAERLQAIYEFEIAYQRLAALVGPDFLTRSSAPD